jgi:RecA/RadA recombinase
MTKPFDVSKFRKSITKSIDGLSVGFNDPTDWVSTGSYALNYLISGDFHKGIPLGKVTVFAGESGAGKSYFASGNIVKNAQAQGIFVVLIDSENALDEAWLKALGVDTADDKLLKLSMCMIDDVAKTISEFMDGYKAMDEEDRPKVLFVIDSLGMLLTPTDVKQFEAGDLKGDLGRKPKALTALVRNTVNMIGAYNVGIVATNHTYASQDMFDPDDKISGGCLTAGHKISMSDNTFKNIEEIVKEDSVITLNGNVAVAETFKFDNKEVFEIELETGEVIQATAEHKFLVSVIDNTFIWKTVGDLKKDDFILYEMNLKKIKIKNIKPIGLHTVYDINVPGEHHYLLENGIISHNSGFIYASSIVVAMKKLKLKEDLDGNKTTTVQGIRAACKVMKTRYAKPFESVHVKIPYETGMNPYSGLVDLAEKQELLTKRGNRLVYINKETGEELLQFRKAWEKNTDGCLDMIMAEISIGVLDTEINNPKEITTEE